MGRWESPFAVHAPAERPAAGQRGPSAAADKRRHAAGVPPPAAHSALLEPACQSKSVWFFLHHFSSASTMCHCTAVLGCIAKTVDGPRGPVKDLEAPDKAAVLCPLSYVACVKSTLVSGGGMTCPTDK